ncbi:MAG: ARMT1-like domain-containing protein, partial [Bacteroidota bacterium]
MKTTDRDPNTYFAMIGDFLKRSDLSESDKKLIGSELSRYLSVKFEKGKFVHPMITKFCTDLYREFYRLAGSNDPYRQLKDASNKEAEKILKTIGKPNSFRDIVKLSIKGNVLDYGAVLALNVDMGKLAKEVQEIGTMSLDIDDCEELEEAIKNAGNVLFLTDNAGEAVFDTRLLDYISRFVPKEKIFIAAKDSPMLNDVTANELKDLGFEKYGEVISTGSNCFGLHEEEMSEEFKDILKNSDVIIAKGQAYLEFFTEYNFQNVFNIATIKYPVVCSAMPVLQPNQNVAISSKRYSGKGKDYNFSAVSPAFALKAKNQLAETLERQKGILFAKPAIVYRGTYKGRDIIAKNSRTGEGYSDERGYVPVEWWIMSLTPAGNPILKKGEGVTQIIMGNGQEISFLDIANAFPDLLGDYKYRWPLTKVLDIGGEPRKTSINTEEVPPIPVHTHSGLVKNGIVQPPGKLEAYFFPPVNVLPYNKDFGRVITRLGLKPDTTKEHLKNAIKEFGKSDIAYSLCNIFEINPYDGWTIKPGIIHAPGPWITLEIQVPQDDFNLVSWQLGEKIKESELKKLKDENCLRGLKDEEDFVNQLVNWELSAEPKFKEKNYRPSKVIEQGAWGRSLRIFFDQFYGEAFEIKSGCEFKRKEDKKPFACIVWSGEGNVNGNKVSAILETGREFFVAAKT